MASFCFVCGAKLRMRYPGNNPENGPATPRCDNDEHPTVNEYAHEEMADEIIEGYLEDLQGPALTPHDVVPATVRLAACEILSWRAQETDEI